MAEKQVEITFKKDKETKGTFRYAENAEEPIIGTLYLRKAAVEELGNPDTITVTVRP